MDDLERDLRALGVGKQISLTEIVKRRKKPEIEVKEELEALLEYDPGLGSFESEKNIFTRGRSGDPIAVKIDKEIGSAIIDLKKSRVEWESCKSEENAASTAKVAERILVRTKEILRVIGRVGYLMGDIEKSKGSFELSKIPETDQKSLKDAIRLLASKIEAPTSPFMWVHAATCAYTLGLLPEAVIFCETAKNFLPDFGPAWILLGSIRKQQKDFPSAERVYERATEIYPKDANLWIAFGTARLKLENYIGAEQVVEQLLKIDPQDTRAYLFLCEIRWAQKDYAAIEQICEDALKIDAKKAPLWRNIGAARLALQDYEGAIQACKHALDLDPKYSDVLSLLGTARYLKEDVEGAIQAYENSLKLNPKNGFAWVNLGEAYEGMGREREALFCYEQGAAWGEAKGSQRAADLYAKEVTPIPPVFLNKT